MKLFISLALIVVTCITTPVLPQRWQRQQQQQQQRQQAQYCVTPENYYGTCVTLSYCPQIANVFQTAGQRQAQQYVILSQRACNTRSINGDPVVCCTRPLSAPQTTQRAPTSNVNNPFLPNRDVLIMKPITTPPPPPPPQIPPTPPTIRPVTSLPTRPPTTEPTTRNDNSGSYCRGPDAREGSCMPIKACNVVVEELQAKQTDQKFARYLRASNAICGGSGTNVCCPGTNVMQPSTSAPLITNSNAIPTRLPTLEENCGYSRNYYRKIVGGEVSKRGAWPWIALLGYDDEVSASPFKCGGTLITARHVVTAAHCLIKGLSFVRLGEHDLSTDTEARHEDIRVVRSEKHPDYNRRNGRADIAILYLERNVQFKDHIAPICLPATGELRHKSWLSFSPFVVGWGKTMEGGDSTNILQELQIPIYENQVCRESYRKQNRLFSEDQFDEAVLCAGLLAGGKDTCQGDSGGPLMVPETYNENVHFFLIGVVSYGIGCARPQIPGVYSSTQYFMDWIIEKVADTP